MPETPPLPPAVADALASWFAYVDNPPGLIADNPERLWAVQHAGRRLRSALGDALAGGAA